MTPVASYIDRIYSRSSADRGLDEFKRSAKSLVSNGLDMLFYVHLAQSGRFTKAESESEVAMAEHKTELSRTIS